MNALYSYFYGSSGEVRANKRLPRKSPRGEHPSESTSLLNGESSTRDEEEVSPPEPPKPTDTKNPSVNEFFFPKGNQSIQRYYQFKASPATPLAALHNRPDADASDVCNPTGRGVTGVLRRSAIVPSHGMDESRTHILVSVGGRSGWARIQTAGSELAPFRPADTFVSRDAWMGNHSFQCKGKVMLGSDAPSLLFSNGLLVIGLTFHFAVLLPRLARASRELPPVWLLSNQEAMLWTSVFLAVWSFATLWITAVIDPGILPALSSPLKPKPPTDGTSFGGPLGYRYCSTCNIFRPPRSKHCNSCNVCVSHFDHHCPWTGNCIGERNHRPFFFFVTFVTFLSLFSMVTDFRLLMCAYQLFMIESGDPLPSNMSSLTDIDNLIQVGHSTSSAVWHVLAHQPVVVVYGVFIFLCSWSLFSLFCYHVLIISVAQTTNERVRGVYGITPNTADRGCCLNWVNFCCKTSPGSRLPSDFSAIVNLEKPRVETVWSRQDPTDL